MKPTNHNFGILIFDQLLSVFVFTRSIAEFVDDFNWLANSQSPNWSIIPDKERIPFTAIKKTTEP